MEELEEAKQQAQAATHAFNAVRQARFDTFMKAFSHISAGIDRIFKVAAGLIASLRQVMLCMAPLYMLVALQIWLAHPNAQMKQTVGAGSDAKYLYISFNLLRDTSSAAQSIISSHTLFVHMIW